MSKTSSPSTIHRPLRSESPSPIASKKGRRRRRRRGRRSFQSWTSPLLSKTMMRMMTKTERMTTTRRAPTTTEKRAIPMGMPQPMRGRAWSRRWIRGRARWWWKRKTMRTLMTVAMTIVVVGGGMKVTTTVISRMTRSPRSISRTFSLPGRGGEQPRSKGFVLLPIETGVITMGEISCDETERRKLKRRWRVILLG